MSLPKRTLGIGLAVGVAAGLGAVGILETTTGQADAQGAAATKGEVQTTQRIASAAVRRSNEALTLLQPVRSGPGWGTSQIANGSITKAKLSTGLRNDQPLWAQVSSSGVLVGDNSATSATRTGLGQYQVTFERSVAGCAAVAQTIELFGETAVVPNPANSTVLLVATGNSAGAQADRAFNVIVTC